ARAAKKKVKSVAKIVKKKVKTDAKVERTKNEAPAARTVKAVKVKPAAKGPDQPLASSEPSRFIPQAIKDQVNKRDGGKCAFTGPGGQRCGSKWNIQVDHIIPFALGGSNKPDNLQLLCRRHNQHKAIKDFGKKKIHSHSKRK
ncbi:MAG: HNH endonuclease, partial [Candidatus Krumholzibacteria bacterium]|nr:HNH endonuclease [Candidatus Krumholzibacteria bacterium]